jgi:peptide/nickel transport system ATP-binding protein
LINDPRHPYTRGLLAANLHDAARGDRLNAIPGAPPALEEPPTGCSFAPRCPLAGPECRVAIPAFVPLGPRRRVACLRAEPVPAE